MLINAAVHCARWQPWWRHSFVQSRAHTAYSFDFQHVTTTSYLFTNLLAPSIHAQHSCWDEHKQCRIQLVVSMPLWWRKSKSWAKEVRMIFLNGGENKKCMGGWELCQAPGIKSCRIDSVRDTFSQDVSTYLLNVILSFHMIHIYHFVMLLQLHLQQSLGSLQSTDSTYQPPFHSSMYFVLTHIPPQLTLPNHTQNTRLQHWVQWNHAWHQYGLLLEARQQTFQHSLLVHRLLNRQENNGECLHPMDQIRIDVLDIVLVLPPLQYS